jgi:hypothetical protein
MHVWLNPTLTDLDMLLTDKRGMLTRTDLHVWQASEMTHNEFCRQSGIDGVRLGLGPETVWVNDEVLVSDQFGWIFGGAGTDVVERQAMLAAYLRSNPRLAMVYPDGFKTGGYS